MNERNLKVVPIYEKSEIASTITPLQQMKRFIESVESGELPEPTKMFMILEWPESYGWRAAGDLTNEQMLYMLQYALHRERKRCFDGQ